jgi:hypothetical protein
MGVILYRQSNLEDELQETKHELRARLAASPAPVATTPELPAEPIAQIETDPGSLSADASERFEKRLSNLEDIVGQLVDAVNGMVEEQEQKKLAASRPDWSALQACGPPDTFTAGDARTAWASAQPNAGPEWLKLDYSGPFQVAGILVRESYNPGAISKVSVVLDNGAEVPVWQGVEPPGGAPVERQYPVSGSLTANSVKVYLDTKRVTGWSEIDAVAIITPDGQRHWATDASASSSYSTRMVDGDLLNTWNLNDAVQTRVGVMDLIRAR